MAFYTGAPLSNNPLPVEGKQPLLRSLGASVSEGFNEGPFVSWGEESRLARLNIDPSAERYNQEDARRLFGEHKIESINVPAEGLTKPYVDAVIQDHQAHLNRQQILQGAPSGTVATPLKYMANLMGNMADPGNALIGLIPFVGEARAATLLGRAGQRFLQGSAYGAAQTAATMPLVAEGQAAQGNDFTMGDYASNFLFGTIGGGILHAGGGVVADALRARDMSTSRVNEVPGAATEKSPSPENGLPIESPAAEPLILQPGIFPDSPTYLARAPSDDLARSIDHYRENYTQQTAYNDVVPSYADNLQELASRQITGVGELQRQVESLTRDIGSLDASLPELTKQYQGKRMKFREARATAQAELDNRRQQLQAEVEQLNSRIGEHQNGARAAQELASISRGELPEPLAQQVSRRADEIRLSLRQSPVAQGVKSAAQKLGESDWMVRNQAMRSAVAQMRRGEDVNIEPFLNLADPKKKITAIEDLSLPRRIPAAQDDVVASASADNQIKFAGESGTTDDALRQAEENLNYTRQINEAISSDDPEFAALMKQVDHEAADTSMEKAIKAAAMCRIGKLNG
ncbi:hypothetical protein ACDX32_19570 [Klebsiella quasipneumoniae]|uniref:hypothetical protein n=1 Tax=Klebsiella quasipneumoniae TaxID=1463165 RepID=UPI0035592917